MPTLLTYPNANQNPWYINAKSMPTGSDLLRAPARMQIHALCQPQKSKDTRKHQT